MGTATQINKTQINRIDKLVLYDGVCKFCNSSIHLILENEKNDTLKFSPLQSELSKELSVIYGFETTQLNSIIFIKNKKTYYKSEAIFLISAYLKFPWNLFQIFKVFPSFISDFFYNIISKSRYSIFGKSDACIVPDSSIRSRFLDSSL